MYLVLKTIHIIAMVAWFSGLFYLPRLFVYHTQTSETIAYARFCTMEKKLYSIIMTPSAIVTLLAGIGMMSMPGVMAWQQAGWLHAKLGLVGCLLLYHGFCHYYLQQFLQQTNQKSERFFRLFNEIPTLLLCGIVGLAILKPF